MESVEIKDVVPEVKLGDCSILFLDASSSCTGFSIAKVDFVKKKAEVTKAGCIWFDPHWEHARKYDYIYNALQNYFEVVEQVDLIVMEKYSVNVKKMSGVLVSPEIAGVIKAAAFSNGVKVIDILPQTWRAALGIKPLGEKGKRDYKTPTEDYVTQYVKVPVEVISNITKKERMTPSDVYDALAIAFGWFKRQNIEVTSDKVEFNSHIGTLGE